MVIYVINQCINLSLPDEICSIPLIFANTEPLPTAYYKGPLLLN